MHFYWSHLEATNVYPIHFTLTAAQIISVFCAVQGKLIAHDLWNGCRFKTSVVSESRCFFKKRMIIWPLCVIASKPTWGTALCVYCFCPVGLIPPMSVCSLPLLCSLSEDWGEPISSCDEGLLWDAAAVREPRRWCCTEVTGCWRGSVARNSHHSINTLVALRS